MTNEVNNITAGYTKVFDLVDNFKTEAGETRAITKQEAAELKKTVQSWANDLKSYQLSVPSGQVNGQMAMAAEKLIGELSTALSNINSVGSLTNGTLSGSLRLCCLIR
ncbi:type III secretion system translocon subunit SctB [Vibrio bivalvicida]|uniref:Type III secretion system translocon subunit SctB n=1 Tax=Vibrio bivalvicida TaxID=1276888 RepID=A0ABV4MGV1_9VIBR